MNYENRYVWQSLSLDYQKKTYTDYVIRIIFLNYEIIKEKKISKIIESFKLLNKKNLCILNPFNDRSTFQRLWSIELILRSKPNHRFTNDLKPYQCIQNIFRAISVRLSYLIRKETHIIWFKRRRRRSEKRQAALIKHSLLRPFYSMYTVPLRVSAVLPKISRFSEGKLYTLTAANFIMVQTGAED